jgi:hypothetical protein
VVNLDKKKILDGFIGMLLPQSARTAATNKTTKLHRIRSLGNVNKMRIRKWRILRCQFPGAIGNCQVLDCVNASQCLEKRTVIATGKRKIAAAQRARWANLKRAKA